MSIYTQAICYEVLSLVIHGTWSYGFVSFFDIMFGRWELFLALTVVVCFLTRNEMSSFHLEHDPKFHLGRFLVDMGVVLGAGSSCAALEISCTWPEPYDHRAHLSNVAFARMSLAAGSCVARAFVRLLEEYSD